MCTRELGQNVVEISHEFQQYTLHRIAFRNGR